MIDMHTVDVSVALCTYNGGPYIREQLASILAQNVAVSEIIVADDGSTDDTVKLIGEVASSLLASGSPTRIRILEGGGGNGVTKNFERAIAACRGEIVALSDQDDIWIPQRLERQLVEFMARPELMLLFGDARLVDEQGKTLDRLLFDTLEITDEVRKKVHSGQAYDVLIRRNIVTGATVVFRRTLVETALPIPPEWVHDEWLAVVAAAIGVVDLLDEPVTDYRQHGSNAIGVRVPTLSNKIRRVLQSRGSRNADLGERSKLLSDRLASLASLVSPRATASAWEKHAFEAERAALPHNRLRRVRSILRMALSGDYGRYASQGRADIIRDLLQPS